MQEFTLACWRRFARGGNKYVTWSSSSRASEGGSRGPIHNRAHDTKVSSS